MQLFHPENRTRSEHNKRIYAYSEIWYTAVDFGAAFAFLVGSVLFFWESTQYSATWLFVAGSVLFAMKPTIRLVRELRYFEEGKFGELADRQDF